MFIKSIVNSFISSRLKRIDNFVKHPFTVQEATLFDLIHKAKNTEIGKRYRFNNIRDVEYFRTWLPLQTYADIRPYIDRMRKGEQNLLWHGDIRWFAKSADDETKLFPVSAEAIEYCHFRGGYDVLGIYASQNPNTKIFMSKTLTLGGSHQINLIENNSFVGDLSAVLIEHFPRWANFVMTPPKNVALLSNLNEKLDIIAKSSVNKRVVALTGAASLNLLMLKHILNCTRRKNILEVWHDMELFVHSGGDFDAYSAEFEKLIPSPLMNYIEIYNSAAGFFAIQNDPYSDDMLLMLDHGIYYEFVPVEQIGKEYPEAVTLDDVEINRNYAMVITTNSGLWRYITGDTLIFTSKNPFKIKISERNKQFINVSNEK